MRVRQVVLGWCLLIVPWQEVAASLAGFGLPLAPLTSNGFDQRGGRDPICRVATRLEDHNNNNLTSLQNMQNISTILVDSFWTDHVQQYTTCPSGTSLQVTNPSQPTLVTNLNEGLLAFVNEIHHFQVTGTLDISQWPGETLITDDATNTAAIGVTCMLCDQSHGHFCSPFYGTHEHTIVYDPIRIQNMSSTSSTTTFEFDFHVTSTAPGSYIALASLFFYTANQNQTQPNYMGYVGAIPLLLDDRVITFLDTPVLRKTSTAARIAIWVTSSLMGLFLLFLMAQVYRHRHSQVLLLTQGKFQLLMLLAALIATLSVFTLEPKNATYCTLPGILIVLPLHVLYATLLGRLWRIHAVMSPLLLLTIQQQKTVSTRMVEFIRRITTCFTTSSKQPHLRQTVSSRQLALCVALFTAPQLLVQLLRIATANYSLQRHYDKDFSTAVDVCSADATHTAVLEGLGMALWFVLFGLICVLCQGFSKDLPSLFNETAVLLEMAVLSIVVAGIALVVHLATRTATVSLDVRTCTAAGAIYSVVFKMAVSLVLPKLYRVWSNERVVVTKLIADHQKQKRDPTVYVPEVAAHSTGVLPNQMPSPDDDDSSDADSSVVLLDRGIRLDDDDHPQANSGNALERVRDSVLRQRRTSNLTGLSIDMLQLENDMSNITLGQPAGDWSSHREEASLQSGGSRRRSFGLESQPAPPSRIESLQSDVVSTSSTPNRQTHESQPPNRIASLQSDGPAVSTASKLESNGGKRTNVRASIVKRSIAVRSKAPHRKESSRRFRYSKSKPLARQSIEIGLNRKFSDTPILVKEDEGPSRRLLLRMIDVQRQLAESNRELLSGGIISKDAWNGLREAAVGLGDVFEEEVMFEWEANLDKSPSVASPLFTPTMFPPPTNLETIPSGQPAALVPNVSGRGGLRADFERVPTTKILEENSEEISNDDDDEEDGLPKK